MLLNLKLLLEQMQASKSSLADLERLNACLASFDDWTVAQFCKATEALMAETPRLPTAKSVNETVISSYLLGLTASRGDRAQLEATLSKMKADKQVRIGELDEIARRYVGGTNKYKNKADAYKDIKLTFEAHITATRRLDAPSNIF